MKQTEFWNQVEQRVRENKQITQGGLPQSWAVAMEWVGLKFWLFALIFSFVFSVWLFRFHYFAVMNIVRWLVWR